MLRSTKALCKASWNKHKYKCLQCCTPLLQNKQYCKFTNLTISDLCLYITSNTLTCSLRWFLMKMVVVYLHENVTRGYKKCQAGGINGKCETVLDKSSTNLLKLPAENLMTWLVKLDVRKNLTNTEFFFIHTQTKKIMLWHGNLYT